MKTLKFKRYNVGDSFDPTSAEKNTLHFVPVSTEPLTVKIYDVDEYGNVAEASFDGWAENKKLVFDEIKKIKDETIKFKKEIVIGEIEPNSTVSFTEELPDEKELNELGYCVVANIQNFTIPNGLIIQSSGSDSLENHVVLNITNLTESTIDLGTKNVVFNVFN